MGPWLFCSSRISPKFLGDKKIKGPYEIRVFGTVFELLCSSIFSVFKYRALLYLLQHYPITIGLHLSMYKVMYPSYYKYRQFTLVIDFSCLHFHNARVTKVFFTYEYTRQKFCAWILCTLIQKKCQKVTGHKHQNFPS